MNPDPDYSAAYLIIETDIELEGHGLTFTIGRGNELCISAFYALEPLIVGLDLSCLLYTSPSPRDRTRSRMPSSA